MYFLKENVSSKKVLCAMELTDRGKVKRFYALKYLTIPQNHYEQYLTNILVKQHKLLLTSGKDINL